MGLFCISTVLEKPLLVKFGIKRKLLSGGKFDTVSDMKWTLRRKYAGNLRSKDALHAGIVLLIMALNLSFGLPRIMPYSAVDEPYWTFERTPDFWRAVKAGAWKNTKINDKPGITVAELSGIGLLTIDPMAYKSLREEPKTPEQLDAINTINVAFRLPIYLFALLSLPLFYILIRKAIGRSVALVSTIFIGLSPIILGISLIINPDSLLWIFLPLAILARLAFGKTHEWKYLILAGILTGLSLLTKYVSNILFVFFLALPFLEYIFALEKPERTIFLKRTLRDFALLIIIALSTFALLFPATWVKPAMILEGTVLSAAFKSTWPLFAGALLFLALDAFLMRGVILGNLLTFFSRFKRILCALFSGCFLALSVFALTNTWFGMKWFDFEAIVMSPKNSEETATLIKSLGNIGADAYSLIFGIHPIALFFLLSALILGILGRFKNTRESLVVFSFVSFILLYYAGSEANYVIATVRYQIALFPLALIVAAIGAVALFQEIPLQKYSSTQHRFFALLVLVAILSGSLFIVRPHYLTYASSLLPSTFILNFKDMGDGSFEAAQYLNALPEARTLRVWSDKGAVCAAFVGDCAVSFNKKRFQENIPDYLVLSAGRKRKTVNMWLSSNVPIRFQDAYESIPAEFTETLGGRPDNFVKVISTKKAWKEEE